jgi:hypothetical protein
MRLYPPAWTLGRQALNDYKIDKYVIPAGSIVLMSQYVMHHNHVTILTQIFFIRIVGPKKQDLSFLDLVISPLEEVSEDV